MFPLSNETIQSAFVAGMLTTHALTFLSLFSPRFTLFFAADARRTRRLGFFFWMLVSLVCLVFFGIYRDYQKGVDTPEGILIVSGLLCTAAFAMACFLCAGRRARRKPNTDSTGNVESMGSAIEIRQPPVVTGGNSSGKVVD